MAYSLRLPDTLDTAARAKADYLGISINALVCVALDAYLRVPAEPAQAGTGPNIPQMGDRENPEISTSHSIELSKAQRRELTRQQRLARKR